MALKIEHVEVTEFLGGTTVSAHFDADTNFIIGLNGTGKTTLINLIRACLECDSVALVNMPFKAITIKFKNTTGRNKPILTTAKTYQNFPSSPVIEYYFREKSSQKELVGRFVYDRAASEHTSFILPRSFHREEGISEIKQNLPAIVWLSIYRGPMVRTDYISQEEVNPIERKIDDIIVSTTKYLSSLDKSYSSLLESFQQRYFLSLINARHINIEESYQYDLSEEQDSVNEIAIEFFKNSDIKNISSFNKSISEHFSRSKASISSYRSTKRLNYTDAVNIADTIRLHNLVIIWKELQNKKEKIYKQKTIFERILSDMLVNKSLVFNSRNQPVIKRETSNQWPKADYPPIELKSLSSGEKQLFIIFGSALVQEDKDFIFLADEPELSLHIEWQRDLVSNLKELNKNSQIVFATHSPDIVAQFSDHVIRMEKFIPRQD